MGNNQSSRRLVFLCSGGGGNLRFIHHAVTCGWLGNSILVGIVTDRECGAEAHARQHSIGHLRADFSDPAQTELLAALESFNPDFVITTVHRILQKGIVQRYKGKLINLHYSLLPAFGGTIGSRPVKDALAYGVKFGGVTAHLVDETLDGGKPVVQAVIPLRESYDADSVMDIVFRCGCLTLGSAIQSCLTDTTGPSEVEQAVQIKGRQCIFSRPMRLANANGDFWEHIRLG
jgi:phosphoribosylglycinamide formyltransferase-1